MAMRKWITVEDASRVLSVSERTGRYWISNDTLATRVGNGKQYALVDSSKQDLCSS